MPWFCPACRTEIRHTAALDDDRPLAGETYRCHVCRLELVFDSHARRMTVAPSEAEPMQSPRFDRRTRTLIEPLEVERRKRQRRHSDN